MISERTTKVCFKWQCLKLKARNASFDLFIACSYWKLYIEYLTTLKTYKYTIFIIYLPKYLNLSNLINQLINLLIFSLKDSLCTNKQSCVLIQLLSIQTKYWKSAFSICVFLQIKYNLFPLNFIIEKYVKYFFSL